MKARRGLVGSVAAMIVLLGATAGAASKDATIRELEAKVAAEPDRVDLLYRLSYAREQAGDYAGAAETARRIVELGETWDAVLRLGWTTLNAGDYAAAVTAYRRATELEPESEDAWLGLQRALMASEAWNDAALAGERALWLNPESYYANVRQGLVRFMLGEDEAARGLYQRALASAPDDTDANLGLGYTLLRLGEPEEALVACRRAAAASPDDPRTQECSAAAEAQVPATDVGGSVSTTYLRYTDPWNLRDLKSLSFSAYAHWPSGVGLWLGGTISESVLRYEEDDFRQANPILGIYYVKDGLNLALVGSWITSNKEEIFNSGLLFARAGYHDGRTGGRLEASATFYPGFSAAQVDPRFDWSPIEHLELSVGPRLIAVTEAGRGRGSDVELALSGQIAVAYSPLDALRLSLIFYGGHQLYAVSFAGLSIWSNDDRFISGYRLGVDWTFHPNVTAMLRFSHDVGDRQADEAHDFHLIGGTAGVSLAF